MVAVWIDAKALDNADQDEHDPAERRLAEFLDNFEPPGWHADALCREYEPEWWFPTRGGSHVVDALEVCGRCLVMADCRAAAMADDHTEGIWGGTTTGTRKAMRRRQAAA